MIRESLVVHKPHHQAHLSTGMKKVLHSCWTKNDVSLYSVDCMVRGFSVGIPFVCTTKFEKEYMKKKLK
jgi:hypothetical protein